MKTPGSAPLRSSDEDEILDFQNMHVNILTQAIQLARSYREISCSVI